MPTALETFGIDPTSGHPERGLALDYAPPSARGALLALFALDAFLPKLARRTREPILAQMRLAWWRDALARVTDAPATGQPLLAALHSVAAEHALDPLRLILVVDGWEALVAGDIPAYARDRGGGLFAAAGRLAGAEDRWIAAAGEGWVLADLALTSPDPAAVAAARAAAGPLLEGALSHRSSRAARPLGALALVARMDLDGRAPGDPRRIARLLRYRFIGR